MKTQLITIIVGALIAIVGGKLGIDLGGSSSLIDFLEKSFGGLIAEGSLLFVLWNQLKPFIKGLTKEDLGAAYDTMAAGGGALGKHVVSKVASRAVDDHVCALQAAVAGDAELVSSLADWDKCRRLRKCQPADPEA
jgi:hypothetical protein